MNVVESKLIGHNCLNSKGLTQRYMYKETSTPIERCFQYLNIYVLSIAIYKNRGNLSIYSHKVKVLINICNLHNLLHFHAAYSGSYRTAEDRSFSNPVSHPLDNLHRIFAFNSIVAIGDIINAALGL
jgi:predicted metallopeptidase